MTSLRQLTELLAQWFPDAELDRLLAAVDPGLATAIPGRVAIRMERCECAASAAKRRGLLPQLLGAMKGEFPELEVSLQELALRLGVSIDAGFRPSDARWFLANVLAKNELQEEGSSHRLVVDLAPAAAEFWPDLRTLTDDERRTSSLLPVVDQLHELRLLDSLCRRLAPEMPSWVVDTFRSPANPDRALSDLESTWLFWRSEAPEIGNSPFEPAVVEELHAAVSRSGSLVWLQGEKGTGKTVAASMAAERLRRAGWPVAAVRLDDERLVPTDDPGNALELHAPLWACLDSAARSRGHALLVIDQLDAAAPESGGRGAVFRLARLLARRMVARSTISLLVICRTHALRPSSMLRQLVDRDAVQVDIVLSPLDQQTRRSLLQRLGDPRSLSPELLDFASTPQNVHMVERALLGTSGPLDPRRVYDLVVERELELATGRGLDFHQVWKAMKALVYHLDALGTLTTRTTNFPGHRTALKALEAGDLLKPLADGSVTFRHETLFDHLWCRICLGDDTSLVNLVRRHRGSPFFRATQVRRAFIYLYERNPEVALGRASELLTAPDVRLFVKLGVLRAVQELGPPNTALRSWFLQQLTSGDEALKQLAATFLPSTPEWTRHWLEAGIASGWLQGDLRRRAVRRLSHGMVEGWPDVGLWLRQRDGDTQLEVLDDILRGRRLPTSDAVATWIDRLSLATQADVNRRRITEVVRDWTPQPGRSVQFWRALAPLLCVISTFIEESREARLVAKESPQPVMLELGSLLQSLEQPGYRVRSRDGAQHWEAWTFDLVQTAATAMGKGGIAPPEPLWSTLTGDHWAGPALALRYLEGLVRADRRRASLALHQAGEALLGPESPGLVPAIHSLTVACWAHASLEARSDFEATVLSLPKPSWDLGVLPEHYLRGLTPLGTEAQRRLATLEESASTDGKPAPPAHRPQELFERPMPALVAVLLDEHANHSNLVNLNQDHTLRLLLAAADHPAIVDLHLERLLFSLSNYRGNLDDTTWTAAVSWVERGLSEEGTTRRALRVIQNTAGRGWGSTVVDRVVEIAIDPEADDPWYAMQFLKERGGRDHESDSRRAQALLTLTNLAANDELALAEVPRAIARSTEDASELTRATAARLVWLQRTKGLSALDALALLRALLEPTQQPWIWRTEHAAGCIRSVAKDTASEVAQIVDQALSVADDGAERAAMLAMWVARWAPTPRSLNSARSLVHHPNRAHRLGAAEFLVEGWNVFWNQDATDAHRSWWIDDLRVLVEDDDHDVRRHAMGWAPNLERGHWHAASDLVAASLESGLDTRGGRHLMAELPDLPDLPTHWAIAAIKGTQALAYSPWDLEGPAHLIEAAMHFFGPDERTRLLDALDELTLRAPEATERMLSMVSRG